MSTTSKPVFPPTDGSVNLPETLDFHTKHNPDKPLYVFTKDDTSNEVTEITYLEFARACHRVAHVVRPNRAGPDGLVVAFMALADTILYQAITIGLIKAGLVPFPISPRNSPEAVVNLLQKASCHRLLTTEVTLRAVLDGIKSHLATNDPHFDLAIEEIPSLGEIYPKLGVETQSDPFEPFPSYVTRPPLTDVVMYLHSSGSTGLPKAIPETHLAITHWAAFPSLTEFRDHIPRFRIAGMALPSFHTLGIYMQVLNPLYGVESSSVYPPTALAKNLLPIMPNPDNILDHARRTGSSNLVVIPALLQVWSQSPDAVDFLKTMDSVCYSGGSVTPKLGDLLVSSGVKLYSIYGGTEFGAPTHPFPRKTDRDVMDWAWQRFSDRAKVRWIAQGDGTYECQLLSSETHCLSLENLPDVKGYSTSDLWEKHPTKAGLWRLVGRTDDVIVHSSGEKTVPAPMEDIIMSSPIVQGTVLFGRDHDQIGVLIEPRPGQEIDVNDEKQLAEMRNKLWPVIEEANKSAPAFSRIFKEMILVTSPAKPMPRAGKGTVMRNATLRVFAEEIETLYETVESSAKMAEAVEPPASWTDNDLQTWLLKQAADIHSGKDFFVTTDLFEQGFDSLSATFLRHRIVATVRTSKDIAVQKAAEGITQNLVYSNPTIKQLSAFVAGLLAYPEGHKSATNGKIHIEEMIEKYSSGLEGSISNVTANRPVKNVATVLLTGSTGNLGSQILASLLEDNSVERVYAFNRPPSGTRSIMERHKARFVDKGLNSRLLGSKKLVFVEGDAAQEKLGLDETLYEELRTSVTLIIHNAWKLDFNLSLSSFESNVRATRNLIDFALAGPYSSTMRFLFTSSVSSAQSWKQEKGLYPEEVLTDAGVAVGGGYGEGKYVAERLLAKSGLQVSSLRIGQISGGLPNGAWSTTDWLPILVKSSLALGALPDGHGVVSWLPMDAVAKAILDIAFAPERPPIALNLVHPRPVEWKSVILTISEAIEQERSLGSDTLPLIPFQDWFSQLEQRAKDGNEIDIRNIPAIKLLEFFRGLAHADTTILHSGGKDSESGGLPKFDTKKVQSISPTINRLEPIGAKDAERWVRYWNAAGLFD